MTIAYETYGEGPHRVLVLHGWFGDASAWRAWQAHLEAARFTYAFVDFRGFGESRDIEGEHTVEEMAGDAVGVADALGWEEFSVVGHSMGGSVAQRVQAMAPERVRALVGISPVPASGVPMDEDTWALFAGAAEDPANRRAIIDLTTGNRLTGVWLDRMVQHSLDRSEAGAFAESLRAWALTDFHQQVQGNPLPVQVIVGEHDPALGEDVMRQTLLQWFPAADLEVMPNAGHYAMDETPVALATSVERFLGAHGS